MQGVSFRAYTKKQADALGLIGWVRNLHDGRVEGLACGPQAELEEFKTRLRKGPPLSRVDRFNIENLEVSPDDKESGFKIIEDGVAPWQKN